MCSWCSTTETKKKPLILQRLLSHDNTVEVVVHPDHVDVFDKTAPDSCGTREIAELSIDPAEQPLLIPSTVLYPETSESASSTNAIIVQGNSSNSNTNSNGREPFG